MVHRNLARLALAAVVVAVTFTTAPGSGASRVVAEAQLIDDAGRVVGSATFTAYTLRRLRLDVEVRLPRDSAEFHGMHLHANDPATGCIAGTGFTGVGGHWDDGTHIHGGHHGDLPSLMRTSRGSAALTVELDKFALDDVVGRALIVHTGPDNFANVPLGTAPNQYTDNESAFLGTGGTAATGNAGDRYACGVVTTG